MVFKKEIWFDGSVMAFKYFMRKKATPFQHKWRYGETGLPLKWLALIEKIKKMFFQSYANQTLYIQPRELTDRPANKVRKQHELNSFNCRVPTVLNERNRHQDY